MSTLVLERRVAGVVVETTTLPPEATIVPGAQQFTIGLPKQWMPLTLKEWDLQYQRSYDNSSFGDWIDVGTFPATSGAGDDPRTADTEYGTGGVYTHQLPDISFPQPYYRYRYRLRTTAQQSEWSEAAFAGQARSIPLLPAPAPTVVTPGSVDNASMGPNSVDSAQIVTDAVIARTIRSDEVTTRHLVAGSINTTKAIIADATINTAMIQDLAVKTAHIDDLQVTNAKIGLAAIDTAQIANLAVTLAKIKTATITDLSVLSTNAGAISAGTITGATVRTAASGARTIMDGTGLRGYALDGVTKVFEINSGSGIASFTGIANIDPTSVVPAKTLTGFIGGGNMIKDSSFESTDPATPASLWAVNGVTITKSATQAFHGGKSLRVNYSSGAAPMTYTDLIANHGIPTAAIRSRPMVISAWVWVDTTATTLAGGAADRALSVHDGTTLTDSTISTLTKGQWNRIVLKLTPAAGTTVLNIRLSNPYTNGPVYYDGIQAEIGDAATAYAPKPDEILYQSISTLELQAGAVTANNISAGAITAGMLTILPSPTITLRNGNFSEGNPADGSALGNGWAFVSGTAYTVQTDPVMGRTARVVNPSAMDSATIQTIPFPVGRTVIRGWVKTTTMGPLGAFLSVGVGTATATISSLVSLTGTNDWTYVERSIDVTVAGTIIIRLRTQDTGTAEFANITLNSSVLNTTLGPDSVTTDKILSRTIVAGDIATDTLTATEIQAGAITADKISLGVATIAVVNGQFNAGNPANGATLGNGWVNWAGNSATVQTDASFGRTARFVNATSISSGMQQTLTLPVGRHVVRAWIKTGTAVTGGAAVVGGGASIYADAPGATATFTLAPALTGNNPWTLRETVIDVTVAGTVNVYLMLSYPATSSGAAEFANVHIIPAVTGTTLTPTSIDAMTITGATFQTAAPGNARVVMSSAGLKFIDATAATTVDLSAAAGGLTILAASTDTPPASRTVRFLHAAGGASSTELSSLSNSTATPTLSNSSFDTNLTGWTTSGANVTRDTSTFDSTPASMKLAASVITESAYASFTGTFKAGITYRISFFSKVTSGGSPAALAELYTSTALTTRITFMRAPVAASFGRQFIEWTPTIDYVNPVLRFAASLATFWVDTIAVEVVSRTILSSLAKPSSTDSSAVMVRAFNQAGSAQSAILLSDDGRSDFALVANRVTSLPSSPYDGQEVAYVANATDNIIWKLKYYLALARWEFVGGSPLLADNSSLGVDFTSTTYATYTGIPSLTIALAGDYIIRHGHSSWHSAAGGSVVMAPSLGGVAPVDATDGAFLNLSSAAGSGGTEQMSVSRLVRKTIAAGTVVDYRAKTNTITAKLRIPWMAITPVYIG